MHFFACLQCFTFHLTTQVMFPVMQSERIFKTNTATICYINRDNLLFISRFFLAGIKRKYLRITHKIELIKSSILTHYCLSLISIGMIPLINNCSWIELHVSMETDQVTHVNSSLRRIKDTMTQMKTSNSEVTILLLMW